MPNNYASNSIASYNNNTNNNKNTQVSKSYMKWQWLTDDKTWIDFDKKHSISIEKLKKQWSKYNSNYH